MARLIRIDDPADPRVEPYRDIRERDLVARQGRFIAEGRVVLETIVRAGRARLTSLLLAEARVGPLSPVLDALAPATPVYCAPQSILNGIAGFPLHRGVLALGEAPPPVEPRTLLALGAEALVVGLFGIANHDNMGGIFRNAAAFGVDAVLLDPRCCEPLYRKAIRVSVGAALSVPFARMAADDDPVALLADLGFETLALTPTGAGRLQDVCRAPRTAVLFGTEGPGLPPALLARTSTVAIPMANGFDSLNVATASGIVLHHLAAR